MSLENVRQCEMCRKPFHSTGGKYCVNCMHKIEEDLLTIKEYLYDNPGNLSVRELAEETEVAEKTIIYLIREGRIELRTPDGGTGLTCEICKKPIEKGTMCPACRDKLARSLAPEPPKPAPKEKETPYSQKKDSRMHIGRDRDKDR